MSIEFISRELVTVAENTFYNVYYIADGYSFRCIIPPEEGDTDAKALAWLNANSDQVTEAAKSHFALEHKLTLDKIDKIERGNFSIEWDAKSEKVKLTDKAGTTDLTTLESRIATLEAKVDALGVKP